MEEKVKVVMVDLGMGDHLLATPALRCLRKKIKDHTIVVGAVYASLFQNNPNIDHLYQLGTKSDLYEKWVKPLKEEKNFCNLKIYEPRYQIFRNEPMSKVICEYMGVDFDEDRLEVFLTKEEEQFGKDFATSLRKPMIVIQVEAARVMAKGGQKFIGEKDWFGDRWDKVVSSLKDKYDFVQVGTKDEYKLKDVKCNLLGKTDVRQTASLLKYCHTFVTIDSLIGHLGPSVGKKGIVLFGRSKISVLGHEYNDNIIVKESCPEIECCRPEPAYGDFVINEKGGLQAWFCPHRNCMKAISVDMVCDHIINFKQ